MVLLVHEMGLGSLFGFSQLCSQNNTALVKSKLAICTIVFIRKKILVQLSYQPAKQKAQKKRIKALKK
jgi:hypothetical protein